MLPRIPSIAQILSVFEEKFSSFIDENPEIQGEDMRPYKKYVRIFVRTVKKQIEQCIRTNLLTSDEEVAQFDALFPSWTKTPPRGDIQTLETQAQKNIPQMKAEDREGTGK